MFTFDTEVHFVSETCLVCWRLLVSCGAQTAGRLSPLNTPTSSAHSCVSGLQTADRRLSLAQRHLLEDDDNTGRKAADQEVTATAEEGGVFTGETTDH